MDEVSRQGKEQHEGKHVVTHEATAFMKEEEEEKRLRADAQTEREGHRGRCQRRLFTFSVQQG